VSDDITEKEDRKTGQIIIRRVLGVSFEFSLQLIDVSTGEVIQINSYNASGRLSFSPGEPEFMIPKNNFEERLRRKAIGTAGYYAKKFIKSFSKPQLVLTKVLKGNSRKVKKFYMEGDGEAWGALRLDVFILEEYEVEGEKIYRKVNIGEAKKKREMYPGLIKGKMAKGNKRVKKALDAGQTVYLKENNRSRNFLVGFFLLPLRLFGPLHKEED
ncbi:MAG: hypothetical protein JJ978_19430, partial [Roseivirga sp.]|uniref:hypothetical protein n=1 Tax=Roseivirga sp. TaxID=1964215 RepID=UPI001AFF289F